LLFRVEGLTSLYRSIEAVEFMQRYSILESRARALFSKASLQVTMDRYGHLFKSDDHKKGDGYDRGGHV
jgi:hypothetical protein